MYNKHHHPNVVLFWKQTRSLPGTWDTQYYVQVSVQGVHQMLCNKSSSMQKEQ